MSESSPQKPRNLRILIADDVWATVQTIRLMLRFVSDVDIVADARDGREAIDMAKEYEPDIALVDINMPLLDGLSVIKAMVDYRPEMACIVMSVEGQKSLLEAKEYGAIDYLIKPFTTEELIAAVERAGQIVRNRQPEARETGILRRKLATAPLREGKTSELRAKRTACLQQLASQYMKEGRTDNQVIAVFEELAMQPYCETHWLKWLAMVYVKRMEWEKLKVLSERMEQLS